MPSKIFFIDRFAPFLIIGTQVYLTSGDQLVYDWSEEQYDRNDEERKTDRARKEGPAVAFRQYKSAAEIGLHQIAQHEADDNRGYRESGLQKEMSQNTDNDRSQDVEWVAANCKGTDHAKKQYCCHQGTFRHFEDHHAQPDEN